jgi:predicted O-methyltransferase YrrM|tara:strand:- start:996 stop:1694 length:699 start_codon:yes stop_codon:yes gene_type:complete
MKNLFNDFLERIEDSEISKIWKNHPGVKRKFFDFFYKDLLEIKNPQIIEFGVRHGVSTSLFLDLCTMNDGKLFSIDENDYEYRFNSTKWNFIKSRDDNFEFLKKKLPNNVDVIFLDTLHKADHVIKILIEYFDNLKEGGYFIIDDISWIPYLKKNLHDHFYKEINNKETFESLLQIYSLNFNVMDIKFNLTDTGSVVIKKLKDEKLFFNKKRLSRDNSLKNYLRLIYKKIFN